MSEPKILPPSMRQQKRYIVFEVISESPVTYGDIISSVWTSMLNFLGELGSSETRVWFVAGLYDDKTQRGVIRCRHDSVEKVRSVLSLIQIIGESRSIVKIIGVTGTIKAAKKKYLTGSLNEFAGE